MRTLPIVVLALVATAAAASTLRGVKVNIGDDDDTTNVCHMNWNYCPRDPGCVTYTCSVHSVTVHDDDTDKPINAENLKPGDKITITVKGVTTLSEVPSVGSYRIYSLAGKNAAAGVLSNVMTINSDHSFEIIITFALDADCFGINEWFEFGLDVFQEESGSDEAMCIEFSDNEYLASEKAKTNPAFEMFCQDEGNGHFIKKTTPLEGHPIPSEECGTPPPPPPSDCTLEWVYCENDPGCVGYDMTVDTVTFDVDDTKAIKAGDHVKLLVNGTTQLTSVPPSGSYKIYSLSGHNLASGALDGALSISGCSSAGCNFGITADFQLTEEAFDPTANWFEVGLDVFRESSGSDESFCIEIGNVPYFDAKKERISPPFDTDCHQPKPYGHWTAGKTPEVIRDVVCNLKP